VESVPGSARAHIAVFALRLAKIEIDNGKSLRAVSHVDHQRIRLIAEGRDEHVEALPHVASGRDMGDAPKEVDREEQIGNTRSWSQAPF
jgi:hypothetical protein